MILFKISSYLYFDEAVALVADEPLCPLFDNPWFFKWLNRHFACKRKKIEQILRILFNLKYATTLIHSKRQYYLHFILNLGHFM